MPLKENACVKPHEYEIVTAHWPADTEEARALLTRYGQYLADSPSGSTGVCIAGYEAELQGLATKYAGNEADLLLARVRGASAGCVAITQRMLSDGTRAAEMKRLWVESAFRGYGVGRGLVEAAVEWARAHACDAVVLDTVNEAMPEAAALYRSLGFRQIDRFNDNPVPGLSFYRLMLR